MVINFPGDDPGMIDENIVTPEPDEADLDEIENEGVEGEGDDEWPYSNSVFGFNLFRAQEYWDNKGLNLFQFMDEIKWAISPCDEDYWIVWRVEEPVDYIEVCEKWGLTIEEFIL